MSPFIDPIDHAINNTSKHLMRGTTSPHICFAANPYQAVLTSSILCPSLLKSGLSYPLAALIAQHSAWCVVENMC